MNSKSSFLFLVLTFISAQVFSQIDHWETAVYAEDDWHYFMGVSEPPQDWTLSSFDDSGWLVGQGGIGYGDQDDYTIISATESLYMRRKFTVLNLSAIESVLFHADFDDGFVAYLNGIEIARTNMEGSPPAYNSWATQLREAQMYSGGIPQEYSLSQSIVNAALVEGENVLTIQTHNFDGLNSSDLTTLYWLSLGINDQSANYGPTPSWFVSPTGAFASNLPIVTINTELPIQDDPKVIGEIGIIWNGPNNSNLSNAEPTEYLGNIAIEYRGQSSSWFPKRGYSFETRDALGNDLDTAFLNFPAEEDWILHGPYSDKSLIRNVLAMEIATRMGQYASRTRQVELVVNGSYEGIYILMEKIKRDKNRVDIANLKPEDIAGDELTGGYVIKIDKGTPDWYSQFDIVNNPGNKLSYQYVSPNRDNIQPAQENYIQGFMNDFENSMFNLSSPYKGKYYYQYMDLKSFADHFIISEITRNVDAYRLSTYMHKDKDSNGGLLKAGPIWDYNLGFGNADYCFGDGVSGWIYEEHCDRGNPFWWEMLFQEERFWNMLERLPDLPKAEHHVAVMHYWPFMESLDEADWNITNGDEYDNWYFSINPPNRQRLWDLLKKANVEILFCGHVHTGRNVQVVDGIRIYRTPAAGNTDQLAERWPDADTRFGFQRCDVTDAGIEVTFIPGNDQCEEFGTFGPLGHPTVDERDYSVSREKPSLTPDGGPGFS